MLMVRKFWVTTALCAAALVIVSCSTRNGQSTPPNVAPPSQQSQAVPAGTPIPAEATAQAAPQQQTVAPVAKTPLKEPSQHETQASPSPTPAVEPAAQPEKQATAQGQSTTKPESQPSQPLKAAATQTPPPKPKAAPPAPKPATAQKQFAVSHELYSKTFDSITKLITELNSIIEHQDYDSWVTYLTPAYKKHFEDPAVLNAASEQPVLKRLHITLHSLKDYFTYVVVPSRSNARLDDLVFVDNTHVKAIMIIENQRTILYYLDKQGNSWKIGLGS